MHVVHALTVLVQVAHPVAVQAEQVTAGAVPVLRYPVAQVRQALVEVVQVAQPAAQSSQVTEGLLLSK